MRDDDHSDGAPYNNREPKIGSQPLHQMAMMIQLSTSI
jgi:hypothetical protein